MLTRRRNLPVGFMASLTAAALLIPDAASAQRSGVRSGVIGSAPTDSAQSGVIGGGYRGAPIGRRERRGWVYPYSNPCIAWTGRLWVRVC
jgi:hypothetical protein